MSRRDDLQTPLKTPTNFKFTDDVSLPPPSSTTDHSILQELLEDEPNSGRRLTRKNTKRSSAEKDRKKVEENSIQQPIIMINDHQIINGNLNQDMDLLTPAVGGTTSSNKAYGRTHISAEPIALPTYIRKIDTMSQGKVNYHLY